MRLPFRFALGSQITCRCLRLFKLGRLAVPAAVFSLTGTATLTPSMRYTRETRSWLMLTPCSALSIAMRLCCSGVIRSEICPE